MGDENATARLPVKPTTKDLIEDRMADGITFDYWIRKEALGVEE